VSCFLTLEIFGLKLLYLPLILKCFLTKLCFETYVHAIETGRTTPNKIGSQQKSAIFRFGKEVDEMFLPPQLLALGRLRTHHPALRESRFLPTRYFFSPAKISAP